MLYLLLCLSKMSQRAFTYQHLLVSVVALLLFNITWVRSDKFVNEDDKCTSNHNDILTDTNERVNNEILSNLADFNVNNEIVCVLCLNKVLIETYSLGNKKIKDELDNNLLGKGSLENANKLFTKQIECNTALKSVFKMYYSQDIFARQSDMQNLNITKLIQKQGISVNFQHGNTISKINNDIKLATDNKIVNFFKDIDQRTKLLLVSAITYSNKWNRKPALRCRDFYLSDGSTIPVNYLKFEEYIQNIHTETIRGVAIPYDNRNHLLLFTSRYGYALPKINSKLIHQLISARKRHVPLYIPKFEIKSFNSSYNEMVRDQLNLKGIYQRGLGPNGLLSISQITLGSQIDMNEEGTEAVGVASAQVVLRILTNDIYVNKPFIFILYDIETKVSSFTGAITRPNFDC